MTTRTRNLLYLLGLLPLIAALLFAGKVGLMLRHQHIGATDYAAGDFRESRDAYADNRWLNVLEPWIAPFNLGGSRYRLDDFDGAISALEEALVDVPDQQECLVRSNLAIVYETVGDLAFEARAMKRAETSWREALGVLDTCRELEPLPQKVGERIDEKLAALLAIKPPKPDKEKPPPKPTKEELERIEEEQAKLREEEVAKRNEEAQRRRDEKRAKDELPEAPPTEAQW